MIFLSATTTYPLTRKLVTGIGCLMLMSAAMGPAEARIRKTEFDQTIINVDFEVTQPLLFADLDNDKQMEIVMVGEDLDHKRMLAIYAVDQVVTKQSDADDSAMEQSNSEQSEVDQADSDSEEIEAQVSETSDLHYRLRQKINIPDSYLLIDVQKLKTAADRILLLDNQGIVALDYQHNKLIPELQVQTLYVQSRAQYLAVDDFAKDMNADGDDDLLLPDLRDTLVAIRQEDGNYQQNRLAIEPWQTTQQNGLNFRLLDQFSADLNGDGVNDLVQAGGDSLLLFVGAASGGYQPQPIRLKTAGEIWPVEWWRLRDASGDTADQSHIDHRKLEAIRDLNHDGVSDMMVRRELSSGVLERKVRYEFYFGQADKQGVKFADKADSEIEIEGTLAELKLLDMNGDGKIEVLTGSFEIGVSQVIGALLSGSIDQEVRVFALNQAIAYKREPELEKDVALNFSLSSGRSGEPVVLSADLNGDQRKELILSAGDERLNIYMGQAEGEMLSSHRSYRFNSDIPKEGSMLTAEDLDGDGSEELVMRYGKQDEQEPRRQIRILRFRGLINRR